MTLLVQSALGIFFVGVIILFFSKTTLESRSLRSFFWANRNLTSWKSGALLLATALSLNGLMYQALLGYKSGIWSVIVQIAWCLGYVFLIMYANRFFTLSQDTLHGQF